MNTKIVLRNIYTIFFKDSIERENDLKEQLGMSEEESKEQRLKLSRLEDENESLMQQLKKMNSSGSGVGGKRAGVGGAKSRGNDDVNDLRLQLEVSEQETSVLRKKVENLLSENLRLNKDVKDLNDEKKKKLSGASSSAAPSWRNSAPSASSQLDELQAELNSTRLKLIERERETERLEAQLRSARASSAGGGSKKGEDLQTKIDVVEKEARVLRERNAQLEAENERLGSEQQKQKYGRKPPASTHEKLQMDKFALEEKVRSMEAQVREANRRADEAQALANSSKQDSVELGKMRREKSNLEREVRQAKDSRDSENAKVRRLERELQAETDKAERSQREVIQAQREKRTAEEDKSTAQRNLSRAEASLKRLEDECDGMRRKNSTNLQQTQEGIKQFKDQIDVLKTEVQEEKKRHRETKRQAEDAGKKEAAKLEDRVKDLEDKWAKSKRINQQRKDKIEQLEEQLEKANKSSAATAKPSAGKKDSEMVKKYELLEEEFVIAKAKWTSEMESTQAAHDKLRSDYDTIQRELRTLRSTYNNKNDDWIKEKLEYQKNVRDLEDSIRNSAGGESWEIERERFKQIIEDRDAQITQLKIEGDVARSQASSLRKDVDDLKLKLLDYEKMSKFQKVVSTDSEAVSNLESQVDELKKQLSAEAKEKKTELNMQKMQHDSKVREFNSYIVQTIYTNVF